MIISPLYNTSSGRCPWLIASEKGGIQFIGLKRAIEHPRELAEFERALISERSKAGMRAARKKGKDLGRPVRLSREQITMRPG